ncbi:MAG: hypothetical protein SOU51_05630 [Collinsella sp.]|nr:hypothetical protein [Collinsella sp.]
MGLFINSHERIDRVLERAMEELDEILIARRSDGSGRPLRDIVGSMSFEVVRDGQEPSYDDRIVQLLYILRYAYGYGYEYRKMYRDAFELLGGVPPRPWIVSLGCGYGIDYWSLVDLLSELGFSYGTPLCYSGVDIVDWGDLEVPFRRVDRNAGSAYHWEDACSWLSSQVRPLHMFRHPDLIVFPKSLLELCSDPVSWESILDSLAAICGHCVIVAVSRPGSFRFSRIGRRSDSGVFERALESLVRGMESRGLCVAESIDASDSWPDDEGEVPAYLSQLKDFSHRYRRYPTQVASYLSELHKRCEFWDEEVPIPCDPSCEFRSEDEDGSFTCRLLDRKPLVRSGYEGYRVYRLER